MLAELRITPVKANADFLGHIARVMRVLKESALRYQVHAMGTTLEGDLEEILGVVRRCHEALCEDSSRVLIELSIDDRRTTEGELVRSLEHVREALPNVPLERLGEGGPEGRRASSGAAH
jgi:uncharacterized protein (TIGR00106 family)